MTEQNNVDEWQRHYFPVGDSLEDSLSFFLPYESNTNRLLPKYAIYYFLIVSDTICIEAYH